jgi:hypothetical protein
VRADEVAVVVVLEVASDGGQNLVVGHGHRSWGQCYDF